MKYSRHTKSNARRAPMRLPESGGQAKLNQMSYHQKRLPNAANANHQLDGSKPRFKSSRARTLIIITVVIIVVLLELPASPEPIIKIASSKGAVSTGQINEYKAASEQILGSSIANRAKLTLDKAGFAHDLMDQFSAIKSVAVSFSLFSYKPTVSLVMREPVLILKTAKGSLLIDATGHVIGSAPSEQADTIKLPVVVDEGANLANKPSSRALPTSYTAFITGLLAQLKADKVSVTKAVLPQGTAEVDVYTTGSKYFAKFNLEGDYKEQAGTYMAARQYLGKQGATPTQYVDLRIAGRAYYK